MTHPQTPFPPPGSAASSASTTRSEDFDAGLRNRRRILGDAWVDRSLENRTPFNAEFQELITRHAWQDIWGRPALGDRTRRFMVLSMMLGIHAYEEFALHVRAALDGPLESRLTPDEIKEVILMAAIYCGVPVANHAFGIATGILREKGLLPPPGPVPQG
ncbi:carboxymuconolactone decarboxylase [Paracidovorax avenae]|uniref:carboxymuconolactone decarboxylase family protein n=1 Tax=Paracidovorax avenae TaxID=80867 RepID=UPI000D165631|nr:carboxymuconolactone decarboxylase family protein [Paracidovorax avenae]AVS61686.1 carboxymuconolactone decarboxylase [Paracidovorax avenae]